MKKWRIWFVPLFMAVSVTIYQIIGNSQSRKEVDNNKMEKQKIRRSVIAGSWYPGDKDELRNQIQQFLENAKAVKVPGEIIALISPHAGYAYSGYTAAHSYKQIMNRTYDAVIIIAPSHREAFDGASVYINGGFETPLGIVPVEQNIAQAIIQADDIVRSSMAGHREEHSLEIQLPFLQVALADLKIVPIALSDYSFQTCQRLANAITAGVKDKHVLIIASTDLYHGYSYDECVEIDNRTIENILLLKPEQLATGITDQTFQACGAGPVIVAELVALKLGANKTKLLYRTNSADVSNQKKGYVVGYCAVAMYKETVQKTDTDTKKVGVELGLKPEDKQTLLKIARQAIENSLENKKLPVIQESSPILKEHRGAFVTLTKKGMLRGCIGYIYPIKPLADTVQEMAVAAAFRDPRFPEVAPSELSQLEIEISVLTPLKEITDINEIEVGKHGIIIEKENRTGLLLPQVATEYGWDRITFLEHTCNKAGLLKDTYKDPKATIKIFSAEVFHE